MKIALIGNMNNNGFSLLRYFRDLGTDAHLFRFDNDSAPALAHFTPEADSWDIARWQPYIHALGADDGLTAIFGWPKQLRPPPSRRGIRDRLAGYDRIVGSGIAPALLRRAGLTLDIFYPYATGIEYIGVPDDLGLAERSGPLKRTMLRYVRQAQIEGVKRARYCINAEFSLTKQKFEEIGKPFLPWAIPMVYYAEPPANASLPDDLSALLSHIRAFDFKVLSHARLMWNRDPALSATQWEIYDKHNDWLIRGFAEFKTRNPTVSAALVLVEYGPDLPAARDLCRELGIEDAVVWLPKMSRKELFLFLSACDVGVGEFVVHDGALWGGTAWEVLAAGKPLLQSFCFADDAYERQFGHPPPPMLRVGAPGDVVTRLEEIHRDGAARARMGLQSKDWFNRYNGIALAGKWLKLLEQPNGARS